MNLYKRSLIFATFLLCCLSLALLVASMSTSHWVEALARRIQDAREDKILHTYSNGHLAIGLFNGKKELNVGYGTRICKNLFLTF